MGNVNFKGVIKMTRDRKQVDADKIAPGMDDGPELNQQATKEEVAEGDSTKVVTLSYDEVDPS
jgi:hypothetical protein